MACQPNRADLGLGTSDPRRASSRRKGLYAGHVTCSKSRAAAINYTGGNFNWLRQRLVRGSAFAEEAKAH
jgi:hypothetical protein